MREKTAPKTFFATLDAIRGIAALLVMWRHVGFFAGIGFRESYLAVDVFFLLSGVVLANAYETRLREGALSVGAFMWLRVARIFPLYLLGSALTALAWLLGGAELPEALPWLLVLACLMLPSFETAQPFPLNHPAWSLFFEMLANFAYAVLVRRLSTRVLGAIVGASALAVLAVLIRGPAHNLDVGWSQDNLYFGLARVGFSFFAGILLFRRYVAQSQRAGAATRNRGARAWLQVALVAVLLMARPWPALQPWFDAFAVLVAFPWLIYRALWCEPVGYAAHAARWLGALSYPVYALHAPLSLWVHQSLDHYAHAPGRLAMAGIGALFVAVLLPLCALLIRYYDTPARLLLLRRAAR